MRSLAEHNNNYGANFTNLYLENNFTPLQKTMLSIKETFTKRRIIMNILVIGANGKAGHRIVEKALKAGHQVTGVVRREGAIEGIRTIVKDALQNS